MEKYLIVLSSLLLVGCAIEEKENPTEEEIVQEEDHTLTETFMLKVDPTYMSKDNDTDARVYIIDPNNMEVYVEGVERGYTDEEREQLAEMTPEEIDEFIGDPVDPVRKIKTLKATREEIILAYDDEEFIFTALSDSYFENEAGMRYEFDEEASIPIDPTE